MATLDPERLKQWTTAALVLQLAKYAMTYAAAERDNALLVGAELNARIPPRVMPTTTPTDGT